MRALRQHTDRGPADLHLVDVPVPEPGPGEVLVRVAAAGVNFADVMQTFGTYGGGPVAPYLAGFEAAGEIVALGADVRGRAVDEHVVGAGAGAFAEFVVMPAGEVLPVPTGWPDEAALGMVLNWATALAALRPVGRLTAGESVVVPGAAGGVGQAAVRIAMQLGAEVVALASPAKQDVVRKLGVAIVLDPSRDDLVRVVRASTGGGADLVLEVGGGASFARSLDLVRPVTGRVVVYGTADGPATVTNTDLVFRYRAQVSGLHIGAFAKHAPAQFADICAELLELVAAGVYPPGTPTGHDLAAGPDVLADLAARRTVGKHFLRP